jgi:hydrogenase maturation protease
VPSRRASTNFKFLTAPLGAAHTCRSIAFAMEVLGVQMNHLSRNRAESRVPILVIGIGNPDCGDDQAGLVVAGKLKAQAICHTRVIESTGDCLSLLEIWKDAESVILIDAARSGAEPGTLYRLEGGAQPLPVGLVRRSSTHGFGVAEAVALARSLNRLPQRIVVFGIEGKNFSAGAPLSSEVEAVLDAVAERIRAEVRLLSDPESIGLR